MICFSSITDLYLTPPPTYLQHGTAFLFPCSVVMNILHYVNRYIACLLKHFKITCFIIKNN